MRKAKGTTRSRLVFTRDAIRRLDQLAVTKFHIPSIVLMENAAVHLAQEARSMTRSRHARVAIFCGPGNNGGDGLAVARHLHNAGLRVEVVLAADPDRYAGDAAANLAIVRAMKIVILYGPPPPRRPNLIVDALLGTGLDRPVREPLAGLIQTINRLRSSAAPVLAVDIPSGLDADTGRPLGIAVRADVTVTLGGLKAGFLKPAARRYLGRVAVADIGVPRELARRLALRTRRRGR